MSKLSHLNGAGHARMVDVGAKAETRRRAMASARVLMRPEIIEMIVSGSVPKGDVLAVSRVAGIMAAKRTAELIPLCHPLGLDAVTVEFEVEKEGIAIRAEAVCTGRTGVEMEALTAASVAALALYDMCKSVDRAMVIERVQLEEKSGGKSGSFVRGKEEDMG